MTITINDGGLLRRLVEGDLRSDGVTDCQRERLEKLVGLGAVERVERPDRRHPAPFYYVISAKGLEAIR